MKALRQKWQAALRCGSLVALVALVALVLPAAVVTAGAAPREAEAATSGAVDPESVLASCIDAIGSQLDPRVAEALARIDGTGRRLLALRSYLRSGDRLAERWSWTQDQIAEYEGSAEHRALQAEIEAVRTAFASENPGFELWVNPQVRSLDRQLESWNTNDSVTRAAADLAAAARELVGSAAFPAADPARALRAIESFLASHRPSPVPTVAAPGLSPHGQMRAVDFQVHQGDRIIAGPRTATIESEWDEAGWSARLDAAVRAASSRFVGPLASPREPWHYTYSPEAVAAQ